MADETVVDPAPAADTPVPDTSTPDTPAVADIHTPDAPDPLDWLNEPQADPNAAPTDPPAAAETPAELQEMLGLSEYVKEPGQVANAIKAADELWNVENGKVPVYQMLEGFRSRNPEGFEKIIREGLIPYIEHITGQKLGGQQEQQTPEQQRLAAIEQRFEDQRQREQQAQQQQQQQRADAAAQTRLDELTKGTFLEGQPNLLAQLAPYLGMSVQQSLQQVLQGNTKSIETAFKGLMKQREADARLWANWQRNNYRQLQRGLPASKGKPAGNPAEPDLAAMSREERVAYLAQG